MKSYNVYGIGHALVDMELPVDDAFLAEMGLEKGTMTLVDAARQEALLAHLTDVPPHRSCGGSAANTMIGLAQFGGRAFHACKVAADETGAFFARDMAANNVDTALDGLRGDGVTGRCLVLITPDAERTMCTNLGISETFSVDELSEEALRKAEYLYIEGYLVTSPSARAAAVEAARLARKHGVRTALTFSDTSMVNFFREGLEEMIGDGLDLLFCNESEALAFTGSPDLEKAQKRLGEVARDFGVTLGAGGAVVRKDGETIRVAGHPVQAVDSNGAGDLFAGAFLYGITNGLSLERSGDLACRAASLLVTQYGARLRPGQGARILSDS